MRDYAITINTTVVTETKERHITLRKELMGQEVDSHTHKFVDAGQSPSVRQQNAISSDMDEKLDGSIIARLMEYRDAKLRILLEGVMDDSVEVVHADDNMHLDPVFVYRMQLPVEFKDANLKALGLLMHKYIVWGCLFDWYAQLGSGEATVYGQQLKDIEEEIQSLIHPDGYAKRPMQPFGPAKRILF